MKEVVHELFSEEQVKERVLEIAEELNKEYAGKSLRLICILRGSVFFFCRACKKAGNAGYDRFYGGVQLWQWYVQFWKIGDTKGFG